MSDLILLLVIPLIIAVLLLVGRRRLTKVITHKFKKLKVRLKPLDTVIDFKLLNLIKFSDISAENFRQKLCSLYEDRINRLSDFDEFIIGNSNSVLVLEALTELRPERNSEAFKELEDMLVTSLSIGSRLKYEQQEQSKVALLDINKRLEGI